MELSGKYPVAELCRLMNINRSGFYKWKQRLSNPPDHLVRLATNTELFRQYHEKYPSHGYRWLNAKIRLDKGIVMSDGYAFKCCNNAGIKCKSKHYRYKKPGEKFKIYPNLIMAGLQIDGPMECIVSDMTAFRLKGVYYELTLYMDLWNDEIVSYALSSRKGDRMTYIHGLEGLIAKKMQCQDIKTVLHSDQGAVYASKDFNKLLPMYGITRSMSRAGTPTDNAAMESINGWVKDEMFTDLHVVGDDVNAEVAKYIKFFNEERPAYSLGYMTPKQYKDAYAS